MAEYIKKEDALAREYLGYIRCSETDWQKGYWAGVDDICHHVKSLTAADVVEVKHGRWLTDKDRDRTWCSVCNVNCGFNYDAAIEELNFCSNCGAKMDGKRRTE